MVSLTPGHEVPARGVGTFCLVPVLAGELEGGIDGFAAAADEEGFAEVVGVVLEEESGEGFGGRGGVGACVDVGDGAHLGKGCFEDLGYG